MRSQATVMVATDGQGRLGGRVVRVMVRTRSEPNLRLLGIWGEPVRGGSRPRRYYPVPDIDEVNAAADFDLFHQDAWDLTINRIVNLQNTFSWSILEVDDDSDLRAGVGRNSGRKVRRRSGRDQLRRLRADHNASGDRRR